MKKQLLSIILALAMCLTMLPTVVWAAGTTEVGTEAELKTAVSNGGSIKLKNNITLSDTLEIEKDVTLDLNGNVLNMSDTVTEKNIIRICYIVGKGGCTLTLTDTNRDKLHRFTPNSDGLWKLDEAKGTKTVNGGIITGAKTSECDGGGVYIDNGYFNMQGGNIVGCQAYCGAAVHLNGGSFTMSGGSIVGCYIQTYISSGDIQPGYGSIMANNGSFIMSGNAIIRDCTAAVCDGKAYSGVYLKYEAAFSISENASIKSCNGTNVHIYKDYDFMNARDLISTVNANGGSIDGDVENNGTITRTATGTDISTYTAFNGTVSGSGKVEDKAKLTASFNSNGGSAVSVQRALKGQKIATPTAPTKTGWKFNGWYTDSNCTKVWNFTSDKLQSNMTLYAKWTDITAPTGEIKLGTSSWKTLLSNVTFGLFFKNSQDVTITANDNSGEAVIIEYLLSNKKLTETELKAKTFTAYSGKFNINPNNEYVIYAKLSDKSGNVTYLSSNGIVLDNIAPIISGIKNGDTYYGDTSFTVTDKYLDTVKIDGKNAAPTDGKYTVAADGNEHTVVATDRAGNKSAEIKLRVITIASIDDSIEGITEANVKSSDKKAIEAVRVLTDSLIDSGKSFTQTEQAELNAIKANTEKLLKRISDVSSEMDDLTARINAYSVDKVKSDDKQTVNELITKINMLLNGNNLTEAEKAAMTALKTAAQALVKKIDGTADEIKAVTDGVNEYSSDSVKSGDKQEIQKLIDRIDALTATDNLTETEKSALAGVKSAAEELIGKIDDTAKKSTDLINNVNAYSIDNVKSENKQDITDLISDIDKLLEEDNLNVAEKQELEKLKADAAALVEKIDTVAGSYQTENADKAKEITSDNVKTENKQDLKATKDELEKVLADYSDNLTESEKKEIQDEIYRIEKAIEVIEMVENVEGLINGLPDTITKADAEAIEAAYNAYNALSAYEQSIINTDVKKKLDTAKEAIEALLKAESDSKVPKTGDNSHMALWLTIFFISGAVLTAGIYGKKKKYSAK